MQEHIFEDRIYYRTNEFKPERLTLVFSHGVSGSSSAWIPYEKIFENKYNLVFYDIRGHGKSKKYSDYSDYEIKKFADDLHDLISSLKIKKFILISNSFAALIALEYIKLWRSTIIANIFTSPAVYMHEGPLAKVARSVLKLARIFPFHSAPRGHVDYQNHQNTSDWDIKRNLADMRNTTLRVHFNVLRRSFNPIEYDLEEINVPTLVIHGETDSMVPMKNSKRMCAKIKNCEFVSLPNVNHNSVHNAVEEMSEAIENFIEKNVLK